MSPSPTRFIPAPNGRAIRVTTLTVCGALLVLLAVLAGCGGGKKEPKDVVLATVGNSDITSSYYEDRLVRLEKNELPRGDDGRPLDMSQLEGKEKFLNTLINKEVMVQTARNMGLENDPGIVTARNSLLAYEASLIMWDRAVQEPASTISPEELEAFYAKMGSSRKCLYVITNFKDDAEAARADAKNGMDWDDIITKYHDGGVAPSGVYEISVPFGRYNPEYEDGVFNTEIGGVTPVINTVYGFWVLKVLEEKPGKKPPLEEAKAEILDVTHLRKLSHLKDEFKAGVLKKYQVTINEDALWKCYQGLPAGETLFREGTQDPRTKDELSPLDIATADMDMPFYSYLDRDGVKKEFTLLDYKTHFDNMSVFQRPKDTEMLGGLRSKIMGEMEKIVLNFEAQDMGLYEDPAVTSKVNLKIEEMIVSKLYVEVIQIDEQVTPEDLTTFWAEHSSEYVARDNRSGRLVVCLNADQAAEAQAQALGGMEWRDILVNYGTDRENKARSGKLDGVILQADEPVSTAMFALEVGQVSEPFPMAEGRYGVVRVDSIEPGHPVEMTEVAEAVGTRIRENRKEEAFQAMMEKWKKDIPVTIFPENLAEVASWTELRAVELPENLVPRN